MSDQNDFQIRLNNAIKELNDICTDTNNINMSRDDKFAHAKLIYNKKQEIKAIALENPIIKRIFELQALGIF